MISSNPAIQAAMNLGLLTSSKISTPGLDAQAGSDFGQQLLGALKEVNAAQLDAGSKQEQLMSGKGKIEIQDVMISMEKASTAMQLTMAVRNKMLEAYQEIEKLPV